jgi:putative membrane protein
MWNGPYGMMGGWDGWGLFWPLHFIIPFLFLALIVTVVVLLVRYAVGWGDRPPPWGERRSAGLEALDERYARGEIDRDEYLQKRRDILES